MAETFGTRVKEVREELGLSQEQLLWDLGITRFSKAQLRGFDQLREQEKHVAVVLLHHYFGINEQWLLTGNGDKYEDGGGKALYEANQIKRVFALAELVKEKIQEMRKALHAFEELQHLTNM